jgi:hypothetical protein
MDADALREFIQTGDQDNRSGRGSEDHSSGRSTEPWPTNVMGPTDQDSSSRRLIEGSGMDVRLPDRYAK